MSKVERETATQAVVRRLKNVVVRLAREEASRALNHFRETWKQSRQDGGTSGSRPEGQPSAQTSPAGRRGTSADGVSPSRPEAGPSANAAAGAPMKRHGSETTRAAAKARQHDAAVKSPGPNQAKSERATPKNASTTATDLNSATHEELVALTGIGPSRAKAIIAGRPYAHVQDLAERRILPQGVLDAIKAQIRVRR